MDYVNIGSVGFAQLGRDDYYKKRQIEKSVILDFISNDNRFIIPENYVRMCHLRMKTFPYEYSSYDELVLVYDCDLLGEWEYSDDEEEQELYNGFWDFFNSLEKICLEEELMSICENKYSEFLKQNPALNVIHKKKDNDKDDGLIAV